jgi:Tfp pilus assembly protein PilN
MRPLLVNFVRPNRSASLLGLVVLGAGVLAAATVFTDFLAARSDLDKAEQRQVRIQESNVKPRPGANLDPALRDGTLEVAKLEGQLNVPWDLILREVEAVADSPIALLTLEGQAPARKLRMTGEAKSMDDVVQYIGRLRKSALIESADLSWHEFKPGRGVDIVRFSLEAVWRQSP